MDDVSAMQLAEDGPTKTQQGTQTKEDKEIEQRLHMQENEERDLYMHMERILDSIKDTP